MTTQPEARRVSGSPMNPAEWHKVNRNTGEPRLDVLRRKIINEEPLQTLHGEFTVTATAEALQEIDNFYNRSFPLKGIIANEEWTIMSNDIIKCADLGGLGGKGGRKDPHELMTASLVLKNKPITSQCIADMKEVDNLIADLKTIAPTVEGHSKDEITSFDGSYMDLAMAISASNKILSRMDSRALRAYITGKKWHDDIAHFRLDHELIKDYNSSDIVFLLENKDYLGISLKKKRRESEKDPTLINKSIESFFRYVFDSDEVERIEYRKLLFYQEFLRFHDTEPAKDIKTVLKQVGTFKNDLILDALKSKHNIFFDAIDNVLLRYQDEFIEEFLKLIFRTELHELKHDGFHFALVTGIGYYGPSVGIDFREGTFQSISEVVELLDKIQNSKKLRIKYPPDRFQIGKRNACATLKYWICADGEPIIDLKIRYKGKFTNSPFLQAVATPIFKSLFKG